MSNTLLNAICPVCGTGCDCYAKQCDLCGFADNLGVNPLWADAEDAREWHKAVVKPLRMEWEIRELRKASAEALKYINSLESKVDVLVEAYKKQCSCNENHDQAIALLQERFEQLLQEKSAPPPVAAPTPIPFASTPIGGIVSFGGYYWRVLDIQNGQALLLSELILESHPYHKEQVSITWENCTLRHYLNNDFYSELPANDRERIAQADDSDKIFLLSIEQVDRYFGSQCFETNLKGFPKKLGGAASWWLRSSGHSGRQAAIVDNGYTVDRFGRLVDSFISGVRPALWLKL